MNPSSYIPSGYVNLNRISEGWPNCHNLPSFYYGIQYENKLFKSPNWCEKYSVGLIDQNNHELCDGSENFCIDCFAKKMNVSTLLPEVLCSIIAEYRKDITVKIVGSNDNIFADGMASIRKHTI